MAKTPHYGIKFPININSIENTLVDLNLTKLDKVKSELMHVIFTPKGQRLRNPEFGTRLIQFLFNPNDSDTWGDIVLEIKESVKQWIPDCKLGKIDVYETDNGLGLLCNLNFSVSNNDGSSNEYEMTVKI